MPAQASDLEDENVSIARARLAQEAMSASRYGARGVRDVTEQFDAASKGEPAK